MAKIAVVYYSLKGETIAPGMKIVNLDKGIRPELKECPDISGYDVIFLGFHNWWKALRPGLASGSGTRFKICEEEQLWNNILASKPQNWDLA